MSGKAQDGDPSHEGASDKCATAQDSAQQVPPATTTIQGATAPEGASTPNINDTNQSADKNRTRASASTTVVQGKADYTWAAQFLKGTHDILWPSEPVTSASPSLITGLALGASEHLMMSKMPAAKPWSRSADERDQSRGVLLDLQEL